MNADNDPAAQQVKYGRNNLPVGSSLTMLNKSGAVLHMEIHPSASCLHG